MPDTKISALPAVTAPAETLELAVNEVGISKKVTAGQLKGLGPAAHATSHQNGGVDEISVVGLSGLLADAQTPLAHGHVIADTTGLQAALDAKEATVNKGAASGYAGLDAGTKVPTAQLGGVGADATKFLRGDQTWQVPAGGGGGASLTRIDGASGAAGADFTVQRLNANSADVTTTALSAAIITTTGLGAGLWKIKYALLCQTALTTTGIGFGLNHTGTATLFHCLLWSTTTGGAAATGVIDGFTTTVAGQLVEGKQGRALNSVNGSTFAGCDTADTTFLVIVEALLLVTASGDLQLKIASEVAGSAVRVMAQSVLELVKVA